MALASPLTQLCVCRLLVDPRSVFASLELLYLSLSSVSVSIFLFRCAIFYFFPSSSVFSNCDVSFCFCTQSFAHAHYLAVVVLFSRNFGFFLFTVPFFFILSLLFSFLRSFAHFPFSSFLSLLGLLTSSLFICLFLIHFFRCFSSGGFLMFLWFLLHCVRSVLSSLINFDFPSLYLVKSFFSLPLAFSQTLVFFCVPSLLSTFFCSMSFGFFFVLLSESLYNSAAISLSLSLSLPLYASNYLFWFCNALWERLLLLTRIFFFTYLALFIFCWCVQNSFAKKFIETIALTPVITNKFSMRLSVVKIST